MLIKWLIHSGDTFCVSFFVRQKVNITHFENCADGNLESSHHAVILKDVEYQLVDDTCDTVAGSYVIPTVNTADKLVNQA